MIPQVAATREVVREVRAFPWLRVLGVIVLCLWLLWHYFIQPAINAVDKVTPWDGLLPFAPISCEQQPEPEPVRAVGWDGMVYDLGRVLGRLRDGDVPSGTEMVGWFRGAGEGAARVNDVLDDGIAGRPAPIPLAPPVPPTTAQVSVPTSGTLTDTQVVSLARSVGWPETEIRSGRLGAYVLAESGNRVAARDYVDGTHQGLLQMGPAERAATGIRNPDDPREALAGALQLWKQRGWQPWTASAVAHRQYLGRAQQAATAQPVVQTASACGTPDAPQGTFVSGYMPEVALAAVPGGRLRTDVAQAFLQMRAAFQHDLGEPLLLTSGYRSYEEQAAVHAAKPGLAAPAGKSNHGLGTALDLGSGVQSFGTREHRWMVDNAGRFGFHLPTWAQRSGSKPEPWHWEYIGRGVEAG